MKEVSYHSINGNSTVLVYKFQELSGFVFSDIYDIDGRISSSLYMYAPKKKVKNNIPGSTARVSHKSDDPPSMML